MVVAGLAGLGLGLGATLVLSGDDVVELPTSPALESTPSEPNQAVAPDGAAAASPQGAVEGFLRAEEADDGVASFGFLSAGDRAGFGSPQRWDAARGDLIPPVQGFEVEEVDGDEVVTLVRFEPDLDQIRGLVPERARVTWMVEAEGDAYGVDLSASTREALYPSDDTAPEAVRQWAQSHQDCATPRTWEGTLQGSPTLAEGLCGLGGQVEVGAAMELGPIETPVFLSAFGPQVGEWARVVAVTVPVPLRAVVAPIGQEWLVIGVLAG